MAATVKGLLRSISTATNPGAEKSIVLVVVMGRLYSSVN